MAKGLLFSCRALAAALCVWTVAGCTGGSGTIEGTVTYQGKKLTSGGVVFVSPAGTMASGEINPDGTYTVQDAPAGPMKVSVSSQDPRGGAAAESSGRNVAKQAAAKAAPKQATPTTWFAIPAKYADPDNSGLSFKVSSGKNKYDITLD